MPISFEEVTGEITPPPRDREQPDASPPPAEQDLQAQIRLALDQEQRRQARLSDR